MSRDMLDIPGWTVVNVERGKGGAVVTAEIPEPVTTCPKCGVVGELYRHGHRPRKLRDTPAHGRKVLVVLRQPRYRCRACGSTFLHPLPEVDEAHAVTKRLLEHIQRQSVLQNFQQVTRETGVPATTVRRIFSEFSDYLEELTVSVTPRWLGIDETKLLRRYRCVLTDIEERRVFEMLPDYDSRQVIAWLAQMPYKTRVEVVAMDMSRNFWRSITAVFPNAVVVVDKFHVLKGVTACMERIRIDYKKTLDATNQRSRLTRDRYVMSRRASALTPKERLILESWTGQHDPLREAYEAKEAFYDIFEPTRPRDEAEAMYDDWQASLNKEMRLAFRKVTTYMRNWREPIFNYFDFQGQVTNAYTESLNSFLKSINQVGRGYSFKAIRAKILFNEYAARWSQNFERDDTGRVLGMHVGHYLGADLSTLNALLEKGEL